MLILERRKSGRAEEQRPEIEVHLINKDKQFIINPMEDLSEDEKMAIITDMINSDPISTSINIKS